MKKIFYASCLGFIVFEILNVYFIMPFPGSQRINSIAVAYLLCSYRWLFRVLFFVGLVATIVHTYKNSAWWKPTLMLLPTLSIVYLFNFKMRADKMFYQTQNLQMVNVANNKIADEKLVVGVEINGQAKAYPIQLIAYHHQVQDSIGGQPVMVTYCSVCRTGRVFQPIVNNKFEKFRLVGMDHFNAMFEDETTGSWWRQVTGEAIAGKLKGQHLPELFCTQTSLHEWLMLHPTSLIMQADEKFNKRYAGLADYESGVDKSSLEGTNSASWQDKSWVVGVALKSGDAKAYDWNRLKKEKIILDEINHQPIVLVLANDEKSFFAFQRPSADAIFTLQNDSIIFNQKKYSLAGIGADDATIKLTPIAAVQEFWHSWRTFHPTTLHY